MKPKKRNFWAFVFVFLLLYIATKLFEQAKELTEVLFVLGIVYVAWKVSEDN